MKKIYAAILLLLAVSFPIVSNNSLYAAGSDSTLLEISASASSAVADNTKTITFTVLAYRNQCASGSTTVQPQCSDGSAPIGKAGQADKVIGVYTTSTGNTFGQTQTFPNGVPYVTTGGDGKAQFTLASSVAESKALTIWISSNGTQGGNNDATATVTFTAPVAAAPKKTTPAPTTQPVEAPAPEAPKVATLEVDGQVQQADQTFTLEASQPLTLKGTTVANGLVKLYIFSTPREATVTADASGAWSYEVADLEPGDHHVEAEVTDPATNKTSAKTTLATFTVAEPVAKDVAKVEAAKSNTWMWYVGAAVMILASAGAATWWFMKKRHQQPQISQDDSNNQLTPPTPPSETPSA